MVAEGSAGTVDWCLEPVRQTFDLLPALPTTDVLFRENHWKGG